MPWDANLHARIIHEYHNSPSGGHFGREKTYAAIATEFYWPHLYKWVRKWIRSREVCQRIISSSSTQAPLRSLPIPQDAWESVSMDFVFGFPKDKLGQTGVVVFVDRFSKMVQLHAVPATVTAESTAEIFINTVFRLHGLPSSITCDRDPRFTSDF